MAMSETFEMRIFIIEGHCPPANLIGCVQQRGHHTYYDLKLAIVK